MTPITFYIVDVFAETRYAGNQLAVVFSYNRISTSTMQEIAKEMHFSETTFILSNRVERGGYPVRIFTPEEEVPFAGHPTLGSAYIIQQHILEGRKVDEVRLNLRAGQIPVRFNYVGGEPDNLWMTQLPPVFGRTFPAEAIGEILRLNVEDIDTRYPVQEVSTGAPVIIVPVKSLAALKGIQVNREKYFKFVQDLSCKTILTFSRETYFAQNDLSVRFFADYLGIPEDPATGSANGCLGAYLSRYQVLGKGDIDLRVEQGYEIGRPSLLLVDVNREGENITVHVGGKVIPVAQGELT